MAGTSTSKNPSERNAEATLHVGQLDDKVSDEILWEFMQQAAPVKHIYIPRDRITGKHYGYAFCELATPLDAAYTLKVLNMVRLFEKPIRLSQSSVDRRSLDCGANLFVGNLSADIDEKLLHDAFSSFGPLIEPACVMRDTATGSSKCFGFIKYATFEAADSAINMMNDQYVGDRPIVVQFAFKKDGKDHERHGSQAERLLAKKSRETVTFSVAAQLRQHTLFADRPPQPGMAHGMMPPPGQQAVPPNWLPPHQQQMYPPVGGPVLPAQNQIGWAPRTPSYPPAGPGWSNQPPPQHQLR